MAAPPAKRVEQGCGGARVVLRLGWGLAVGLGVGVWGGFQRRNGRVYAAGGRSRGAGSKRHVAVGSVRCCATWRSSTMPLFPAAASWLGWVLLGPGLRAPGALVSHGHAHRRWAVPAGRYEPPTASPVRLCAACTYALPQRLPCSRVISSTRAACARAAGKASGGKAPRR